MARATRDGVRRRNQHSFRMARSALLLTSLIVTLDSMIYRTTKFSLAGRQKAIPPPHHLRPAVVKTNSAHAQREGRASGHSFYTVHAQACGSEYFGRQSRSTSSWMYMNWRMWASSIQWMRRAAHDDTLVSAHPIFIIVHLQRRKLLWLQTLQILLQCINDTLSKSS